MHVSGCSGGTGDVPGQGAELASPTFAILSNSMTSDRYDESCYYENRGMLVNN